jgi:acyl carrier protein
VLNREQLSVTDNFFNLGGHSLMALQLMAAIKNEIGKDLPLTALFRGSTIEAMAQLLREGRESQPDPIVMQVQSGEGVPFFAVVAPGAPAIGYAALARAMGSGQPFYKLQSHRVVSPTSPITLDEMRVLADG